MRYALAHFLFRLRFPAGGITATDFRPHFEGHLLNVSVCIPQGLDQAAREVALSHKLRQMAGWMRRLRFLLRRGDRVQYCIGTARPQQQYLKAWSSWEDLSKGVPPQDIAEYWRENTT